MPTEKYVIRHADKKDLDQILEFFRTNRVKENMGRDKAAMARSIDDKCLFLLERLGGGKKEITGVSGVFNHLNGDYMELGGTRITSNGYGFQKVFLSCRLIHQLFLESDFKRIYCTIVPGNKRSISSTLKSGYFKVRA